MKKAWITMVFLLILLPGTPDSVFAQTHAAITTFSFTWIPESVQLAPPKATVGIRGTRFIIKVD